MIARTARLTAALAAGALLLTACGDDGDTDTGADGAASEQPTPAGSSQAEESAAQDDGSASGEAQVVEVSTLEGDDCPGDTEGADHPDVVGATFTPASDGAYDVGVTLCSLYDTPDRYADAWRVTTPDGDELGVRELLHDHAGEQPFTRSLSGPITVPDDVTTVIVEGRDQANGWGGSTLEIELG